MFTLANSELILVSNGRSRWVSRRFERLKRSLLSLWWWEKERPGWCWRRRASSSLSTSPGKSGVRLSFYSLTFGRLCQNCFETSSWGRGTRQAEPVVVLNCDVASSLFFVSIAIKMSATFITDYHHLLAGCHCKLKRQHDVIFSTTIDVSKCIVGFIILSPLFPYSFKVPKPLLLAST